MQPKSLSASAALVFEHCPARYKAEYIDRIPDLSGMAGSLGSACHAALEFWVGQNYHTKNWGTVGQRQKALMVVWESVYPDFFPDRSNFEAGWKLLKEWVNRTVFTGRTVLSCEVKETFMLPTSQGEIPVTYIWDRCDRIEVDGGFDIDVVDYKTVIQPISSNDLKNRIQPRIYALAAAIKYKEAKTIWVTYDLLRYTPVSVAFSREDNIITWNYLKLLAERIYNSDGSEEKLNPDCKYCLRKLGCDSLRNHSQNHGILSVCDSLEFAIDQRAEVKSAADGLNSLLNQLDELILNMAEAEEVLAVDTNHNNMVITANKRRELDQQRAAVILGPEIMSRYGKINLTELDNIWDELSTEQQTQLKSLTTIQYSSPKVKTKPRHNLRSEED